MHDDKEYQDNHKMDTLSERMNDLKERGFEKEFKLEGNKLMCTDDNENAFGPDQMKIVEFYRFEGESDPGDMTVLYAVETKDGTKGIITDGFGTYSNPELSTFLKKIEEVHKGGNVY